LIEVLVVIVIISVLIGILIPALSGVMSTARIAEARKEISDLEMAITKFKSAYGIYPPSGITLYATATGGSGGWDGDSRSKGLIRTMWPQFDFDNSPAGGGSWPTPQKLNGAECLVFFLGGVHEPSGARRGFSQDPALPFKLGGNRKGPFFEFDIGKFVDIYSDPPGTPNTFSEYLGTLSSQTQPIWYLSSYDGRGYRTDDLGHSSMTKLYRQGTRLPAEPVPAQLEPAWNSNYVQIISPGRDSEYGTGGPYDADSATSQLIGARDSERDNLTNFHSTQLAP
jgi:type II secretory pathway pseudopilin PulG